jgi:predicted MFS family arabinose efflux permease
LIGPGPGAGRGAVCIETNLRPGLRRGIEGRQLPSTPAQTADPHRLIVLLSAGAFGSAASMRIADAQLPALASGFEVSLGDAASVITVFSVAYGLMQLVFGPLADRFGKWQVVSLTVLASAVTAAACALASDFPALLWARFAAGATCAAVIPMAMAWIGDAVPYERRQAVLARFLTGQILGLAAGQWLGGLAADYGLWRAPFALLALCFLAAGVLLWRSRRAALEAAPPQPRSGHPVREAAEVLRIPWARVVLAVVFLEGVAVFGALAFMATHLHLAFELSLARAGAIVMLFAGGGLLFVTVSAVFVRRLGEAGLARGGGALMALALLAAALSPLWWTAPLACTLLGAGFYMMHTTLQANATQMAPQARGAAVSLFAAGLFLGQTAGVFVASRLVERFGTAPVLAVGGASLLLLGLLFARLRRRRQG